MPPNDQTDILHRFYCHTLPHPRQNEPFCTLNREQTRHARKVLRIQIGQRVELFDGHGRLAQATVIDYQSNTALCQVHEMEIFEPDRPRITVAAAVPKGGRGDDMVNQLSQAGADNFIPMRTERSIVDPREAKLDRYAAAAIESAKQSRRLFLMQVEAVEDFQEVLARQRDIALIACPGVPLIADLGQQLRQANHVMLLIGPEGGFTDNEIDKATQAGCVPWRMGAHVLRVETAAVVGAAIVRYLAEGVRE